MANFVSYADATELMTEIGNKFDSLKGGYKIRGSVTFANLPATLTETMNGYTYNITDDFTTDARFVEGAGKKYPAGTNVTVMNFGDDETPDMKFDVPVGFIDVDAIYQEIDAVGDMITTTEFDDTATYAIGDIVKYQNGLYKFKSAHAAGAWNSAEVDQIDVLTLVEAAEPDSLTSEQIAALLGLLD